MKKVCILLVVIIIVQFGSICYLLHSNIAEDNTKIGLDFTSTKHYTETVIEKYSINKETVINGKVSGVDYVNTADYTYKNTCELLVQLDDNVPAKTPILQLDNEQIIFENPVRIVKCDIYEEYVQLVYLDFSKLYIYSQFDKVYMDAVNRDLKVIATHNDMEIGDVVISEIGYEIKEGLIDIVLSSEELLLPGTDVEIHLIFEVLEEQYVIYNEFVKRNEEGYYLTYLDGKDERYVYIDVIYQGAEFTAISIDEEYVSRRFVNADY